MYETMVGIIYNLFEMKRIRNPPVIKVTGPDALLFGYDTNSFWMRIL